MRRPMNLDGSDTMANHFFIQSRLNGFVLDVQGGSTAPGTPVITFPKKTSGTDNQLWRLDDNGFLVSKLTGFVLDIRGANPSPGTPVIAFPRKTSGTQNQQWSLVHEGFIASLLNSLVLD